MLNREKLVSGIANIPKDLQDLKTWCGFYTNDNGILIKKPLSLIDFKGVGVTETDRLVDFNTAAESLRTGKVAALGVGLIADMRDWYGLKVVCYR